MEGALEDAAARSGQPPPLRLEHDSDGVWYLRFGLPGPEWMGLAGPAWTVTPRYLVLSWSPMALREYLDKVGEAVRGPAEGAEPFWESTRVWGARGLRLWYFING